MTSVSPSASAIASQMRFDQWVEKYQPEQNPFDKYASVDGYMFDAGGEGLRYVLKIAGVASERVWTVVDNDEDELTPSEDDIGTNRWFIVDGLRCCNRLGYIITKLGFIPSIDCPGMEVEYD